MDLVCDELGGRGIRGQSLAPLASLLGRSDKCKELPFLHLSPHPVIKSSSGPGHTWDTMLALLLMVKRATFSDSVGAGGLLATLTLKDL